MNVDFTPEQQPFVQQAIESGRIHHPEEAAREAFTLWVERERAQAKSALNKTRAQAAAASILALREGTLLPEGVTIRSLIDAGRD